MAKHVWLSILTFFLLGVQTWAQAPSFKEGQWEIRLKMKIEGAPFALPEQTVKQCMTHDNYVPKPGAPGMSSEEFKCESVRQDVSGNKASWEMKCEVEGGVVYMEGEMTYSDQNFEGAMQMRGEGGQLAGAQFSYQMLGKYIGPCAE